MKVKDLSEIRDRARQNLKIREGEQEKRVVVGMGTCGIAAGARETMAAVLDEIDRLGLDNVTVTQTGCIGRCEQEPLVDVYLPGREKVTYGKVDDARAREIIRRHVAEGQVISDWVI